MLWPALFLIPKLPFLLLSTYLNPYPLQFSLLPGAFLDYLPLT